jgi:16S rRNA processing protein RimM
MKIDACYKIGYILKPHGLKGYVTVSIDPEAPNDFSALTSVFLEDQSRLVPYFIEEISVQGSRAIIKFEDVNTETEARSISKNALYLPKTERPKSTRGEFYDDEIIGFTVTDEEAGVLGAVTEVTKAGANRLLVINREGTEVLIPVNGPFILSINKTKKKISVNLPEGFLDI